MVVTRDSSSCRTSLTVEDTGAACMERVSPPVVLKVICLTRTTDAVLRTQNAKISVRATPLRTQVGITSDITSVGFALYEGYSKRIAYLYLETSNFKKAQKCSFHAIKELSVARNAKLQPMYPLPEGVTVR